MKKQLKSTILKVLAIGCLLATAASANYSFCSQNNLHHGYNIIDPDGDISHSYEVFCDGKDTYLSLVVVDDNAGGNKAYSNFMLPDTSSGRNGNYYKSKLNHPITPINKIKIEMDGQNNVYFKEDGKTFGNLNLTGTPFVVDTSNLDKSNLKVALDGQVIKIDNIQNKVFSSNGPLLIKLKLLPDYKFLKFDDINNGKEFLEKSCAGIYNNVPNSVGYLPDDQANGHYWIDPNKSGRGSSHNHPFVAKCLLKTGIHNSQQEGWTILTVLDGIPTSKMSDHDTCTQNNMMLFVPDSEKSFNVLKDYYSANKDQWDKYTGDLNEKLGGARYLSHYANNIPDFMFLPAFSVIWPYGPFGLYNENNGDPLWRGSIFNGDGTMVGKPMNSEGLGSVGWKTLQIDLPSGQKITNRFWISKMYAGENVIFKQRDAQNLLSIVGQSSSLIAICSSPSIIIQTRPVGACVPPAYYRPDAMYKANHWLRFFTSASGIVYHLEDFEGTYEISKHYHYTCMAKDNYLPVKRTPHADPILNSHYFAIVETADGSKPQVGDNIHIPKYHNGKIWTKVSGLPTSFYLVRLDKDQSEQDATIIDGGGISVSVSLRNFNNKNNDKPIGNFTLNNGYQRFGGIVGAGSITYKSHKNLGFIIKYNQIKTETDHFAVRPDAIVFSNQKQGGPIKDRAGNSIDLGKVIGWKQSGIDGGYIPPQNLNSEITYYLSDGTEDISNILHHTPVDISKNNDSYILIYDNVGIIGVKIRDEEWADIDKDDGEPEDCSKQSRFICPYGNKDLKLEFNVHHYQIEKARIANNNPILLTKGDSPEAGAQLFMTIIAAANGGNITTNFSSEKGFYSSKIETRLRDVNISNNPKLHFISQELSMTDKQKFKNGKFVIDESTSAKILFNYKIITTDPTDHIDPFKLGPNPLNIMIAGADGGQGGATSEIVSHNVFYEGSIKVTPEVFTVMPKQNKLNVPIIVSVYCSLGDGECDRNFHLKDPVSDKHMGNWYTTIDSPDNNISSRSIQVKLDCNTTGIFNGPTEKTFHIDKIGLNTFTLNFLPNRPNGEFKGFLINGKTDEAFITEDKYLFDLRVNDANSNGDVNSSGDVKYIVGRRMDW